MIPARSPQSPRVMVVPDVEAWPGLQRARTWLMLNQLSSKLIGTVQDDLKSGTGFGG